MKKLILITALLTAGQTSMTMAEPVEKPGETKGVAVIIGSMVTGAVAAGPVGAIAGAIAGSWLGVKVEEADQLESTEMALVSLERQLQDTHGQLLLAEQSAHQYQQFALQQLDVEMFFKTGSSELTPVAEKKLQQLAQLLDEHAELSVRLDGHADPRGEEVYNQQLSTARVERVKSYLIEQGVVINRFVTFSHGAQQSTASAGDYDSYALERVVKVKLSRADQNSAGEIVQVNTP